MKAVGGYQLLDMVLLVLLKVGNPISITLLTLILLVKATRHDK